MNMDEILTLVQAVSDSKLTSFKLDQGDMHISLKKEKEEAKIITVGAPGAVAAVPAPSAAPVLTAASTGAEAPAAAPEAAELVIVTERVKECNMQEALKALMEIPSIQEISSIIREY